MSGDRRPVEAVKASLAAPLDVVRRLGLERGAQRQAGGVLVRCPAHGDRTPSCSITGGSDGTLRVHCFGCDLSGDVFDLIAAVERLDRRKDFVEVLRRAGELARVDVEAPPREHAGPPPRSKARPTVDDETFAAIVAPMLHVGGLAAGAAEVIADVAAYLDGRGLREAAAREGWGALPRPEEQPAWVKLLLDVFGTKSVGRSGLVAGDRFAHPEARLVIPWRDPEGRVYTLQRRRIDDGKPKYVGSAGRVMRWPYGVHRLGRAEEASVIAIVEGAVDVLALDLLALQGGPRIVALGIPGVSNWRAEWGRLARGRRAVVALDADEAGERAINVIARDLREGGAIDVERWRPRDGAKDWAEAAQR